MGIDTYFQNDIIARLSMINSANGFINTPSVLDGYIVHYAADLMDPGSGIHFPCLAAQLGSDVVTASNNNHGAKIARSVTILGAVSVTDRDTVNARLNSLALDVRRALAGVDNETNPRRITIGNTTYDLPDSKDVYAFFRMDVVIHYNEKWDTTL